MPDRFIDEVENEHPGWVEIQLNHWARWIDTRLRKRYATPFLAHDAAPDPTPPQIQTWLAQLVTVEVWLKRGVDSNDRQFDLINERAGTAKEEILEAAKDDDSWFDLPLRVSADGTLIAKPAPRFYSEQSPYVNTDRRSESAKTEDQNGTGTSG